MKYLVPMLVCLGLVVLLAGPNRGRASGSIAFVFAGILLLALLFGLLLLRD